MDVPNRHQLKIARDTMRMHCAGALIMGGPNHFEAIAIIQRLTGERVKASGDCTCQGGQS